MEAILCAEQLLASNEDSLITFKIGTADVRS